MTERLYYRDATLLTFKAVVTRMESTDERSRLFLDRSAFYPTSGGQLHDLGTIDGQPIIEVVETDDGDVAHLIAKSAIAVGCTVVGEVNAERRLRNCQQHTAQHILSQLFAQRLRAETVSVHLGVDYGAVELDVASLPDEAWRVVEREANAMVAANHAVDILFVSAEGASCLPLRKQPNRAGTLRVIKIGNLDYSACGGTHCNSTAEVRIIKLIGTEKIRGHLLVKFLAGEQAYDDYQMRFDVTDSLSKALTCHPNDLTAKSMGLVAENKELRKQIVQLQKELLPQRAAALAARAITVDAVNIVAEELPGCEPAILSSMAATVSESIRGVVMLINGDRVVIAAAEGSGFSADAIVRTLCTKLGLRGGGNARVAQFGGADCSGIDRYWEMLLALVRDA